MWAQFRVWRKPPGGGKARPAELLPRIYGGLYDPILAGYVEGAVPKPGQVVEISCHPGQIEFLTYDKKKLRVLLLGGPGSGKSEAAVRKHLMRRLDRCHSTGGMVGATAPRVKLLWDMLLAVIEPLGWLASKQEADGVIGLVNGSRSVFKTGQAPSKRVGTSIQGQTWDDADVDETQNVPDRAQNDIDERGRTAGEDYSVSETATLVDELPSFIIKLKEYEDHPDREILTIDPLENSFIEEFHWERLKRKYTARQWRRRILSDYKIPSDKKVYANFSYTENIRPRPHPDEVDYTEITREKARRFDRECPFIIGHDFGVRTSASEVLKAYRHNPTGQTHWWVVGELTTGEYLGTEGHARRLVKAYSVDDFVVSADPHINTKDTDKSDYNIFRRYEIDVHRAFAGRIAVRHRIGMLNALFGDADSPRRLFVDCDERHRPVSPRLVESLETMEYDEHGNPEAVRKDASDPTHWPAALGYGLFPWEKIMAPVAGPDDHNEDPILSKHARLMARKAS
jgi:hypothetical protein